MSGYRGLERGRGPKKIARYIEAVYNAQYKISVYVSPLSNPLREA